MGGQGQSNDGASTARGVSSSSSSSSGAGNSSGSSSSSRSGASTISSEEEFLVPADENFPRCPMSKEVFSQKWDVDEGELMYKNAAKVLCTAAADATVYRLGKPTVPAASAGIRYVIVHKELVLDDWRRAGRAASLKETKERYEAVTSGPSKAAYIAALEEAAGDSVDDSKVFVMLELS